MGKQRVEVHRLNFDTTCMTDLISGNGFLVTDPAEIEVDDVRKKAINGPQSPLYGMSFNDEEQWSGRWRCECGEFHGVAFRGEVCPKCKKKVEFRDVDPNITGWIPLGQEKVIAPHYFRIIQNVMPKNVFTEMIYQQQKVDRDGRRSELSAEEKASFNPNNPFYGIGVEQFRYRFDEIMDWAVKEKPIKAETIETIKKEKLKVFTSFLPVYSPILRQQSSTSENFYYTGVD